MAASARPSNGPRPIPEPPAWIEVAEGWFWMGGGPRSNENPRHRVWVDGFRLAATQVTREQYQAFVAATERATPPFWDEARFGHPRMPAIGPSWDDAVAFCTWAGELWDLALRLPTEAEWEHAARSGHGGEVTYPWGDAPPDEGLADYAERWLDAPEPVDAYPPAHPLGFFGLGENVHEWCADWYDADYYASSPERNPSGPASGKRRASRGGAWRHEVKASRCAARSAIPPTFQYSDYGFRLAL